MKKIDLSSWDRFDIYDHFRKLDHPRYVMTFELDVTRFVKEVKEQKQSFYLSFIHLIMKIMNQHEAFHYRIDGNDVLYYEILHPSFTDLIENTDRFKIITTNYESDVSLFSCRLIWYRQS